MGRKLSAGVVSISATISETEHEAAVLSLSAVHQPSQHEPCPRLTPTRLPHPLPHLHPPTFNRSSMPPWMHMRTRQKPSFSPILLPPSYSPATRRPPFCRSFKVSSSNSITIAGAMRGYQIGSTRQSMFFMHFPPLSVKALVPSVLIEYLPRFRDLIVIPQIFSPASVVFSGIGVLLSVSIILDLSARAKMTVVLVRRLKM